MPNWCNNILVVKGKKKDLIVFKDEVKSDNEEEQKTFIDFNKIINIDYIDEKNKDKWNKLSDNDKNNRWKNDFGLFSYNNGGYEESIDRWGTKWQSDIAEPEFQDKNTLIYVFDSAWSPPIEIVIALIEKYKHLNFLFEYEEWGMAFAGKIESKNGKVIVSEEWDTDIGECPNCEYTNIKRKEDDNYECSDCGLKYSEDEIKSDEEDEEDKNEVQKNVV